MADPLNEAERAAILRMAGLDDATVAELSPEMTPEVSCQVSEEMSLDDLENDLNEIGRASISQEAPPASVPQVSAPTWAVAEIVTLILNKAHGDKTLAMTLVEGHVKGEFDRIKLSKLQAAAQGLDEASKREHNANAWKYAQGVGDQIKTDIRAEFRKNGGFVQAKITKGKPVEAFVRANEENPVVQAFLKLMQEGTS